MAEYNSSFTGKEIDERLGKVPELEATVGQLSAEKMNKVSGTEGQYIGFDADGNAVAVDFAEKQSETLEPVYTSGTVSNTSFAYTETTTRGKLWVWKESSKVGGTVQIEWDTTQLTSFEMILWFFKDGVPYKYIPGTAFPNGAGPGEWDISNKLMDPGTGAGFVKVQGPVSFNVPDGCTVMISGRFLRAVDIGSSVGTAVVPDGSNLDVSNTGSDLFVPYWIVDGGVTVTHITEATVADEAVKFTEQSLTEEQKAQARANIGAAADAVSVSTEMEAKLRAFAAHFNNSGDAESFIFFTDPHTLQSNTLQTMNAEIETYLKPIKAYYDRTPTSFVICGGDWIGSGDTQEQACFKLGVADGSMRKMFAPYYLALGNHDMNVLGVDETGVAGTGELSEKTIRNLLFRETGKSYYSFDGSQTKFYVFDSGNNGIDDMIAYRLEQEQWFAEQLMDSEAGHSVIVSHIAYNSDGTNTFLTTFITRLTAVANAYNKRTLIVVSGKTYDYSASTGFVEFVISGHTHEDKIGVCNDIPIVVTTNLKCDGLVSFDLCFVDYSKGTLQLVRVGSGSSRTINVVCSGSLASYTNLTPTAEAFSGSGVFNGVGYMNNHKATYSSPYYTAANGYCVTGLLDYVVPNSGLPPVIYIKGDVEFDTTSSTAISFWKSEKAYAWIRSGPSELATIFTITKLSDGYYSLEPVADSNGRSPLVNNVGTGIVDIAISFKGSGNGLIITMDEPIE